MRVFASAARPLLSGALWLGILGCRPGAPRNPAPPPPQARADDVQRLPAFGDAEAPTPVGPERYYVELGDAPSRGPADAPLTLVMFSDFECPYCARGHEIVQQLEQRYGNDLRFVYKAFPLDMHPHALVAAMAARSAQAQGKFWPFHDLLLGSEGLSPERVLELAARAGVDTGRMLRDIEALEYATEVRRDLRQGRRLGLTSTPTFFINGRIVTGAKPLEDFEAIIADELERAGQWQREGIPRAALYEHAIAEGWRKVEYAGGRTGLDPDGVYVVPLADSPTLGPAHAPVTIVAFEDFECRFCVRGNATLRALRAIYGDRLRLVFKHQPLQFHSHAFLAARASAAAHAQGKFWAYHDRLYELDAKLAKADFVAIARELGLDVPAFERAMSSTELDRSIEADIELAMSLGVNGTPAYFVNGRPLEGAVPLLTFRLLVEEELDRARGLLEQGVAPERLYHELTHRPLD